MDLEFVSDHSHWESLFKVAPTKSHSGNLATWQVPLKPSSIFHSPTPSGIRASFRLDFHLNFASSLPHLNIQSLLVVVIVTVQILMKSWWWEGGEADKRSKLQKLPPCEKRQNLPGTWWEDIWHTHTWGSNLCQIPIWIVTSTNWQRSHNVQTAPPPPNTPSPYLAVKQDHQQCGAANSGWELCVLKHLYPRSLICQICVTAPPSKHLLFKAKFAIFSP